MNPVRKNHEITAREVRVIGHDGKQLGIFSINDALNIARGLRMDLVEIAPNACGFGSDPSSSRESKGFQGVLPIWPLKHHRSRIHGPQVGASLLE